MSTCMQLPRRRHATKGLHITTDSAPGQKGATASQVRHKTSLVWEREGEVPNRDHTFSDPVLCPALSLVREPTAPRYPPPNRNRLIVVAPEQCQNAPKHNSSCREQGYQPELSPARTGAVLWATQCARWIPRPGLPWRTSRVWKDAWW